ncbi:MAG: signal peptidase I [Planctomycetes bacterium]|nr:signal peptidase I [Planctomycetota bacterium]
MRKWLVRLAWAAVLGVCAVFVLQAFVADVYRVESGSMEPVLHGPDGARPGESVLVLYGVDEPRRFDLVVLRRPDEDEPFVKRIVGLPGETVTLSGGDLLVDGRRLPADTPRPEPLLVFDERHLPMERAFPELAKRATRMGDAWRIEATDHATLEFPYAPRITDGFWSPTDEWIEGSELPNDLGVELDVRLVTPDATVTVELTEGGERYRAIVSRADADESFRVTVARDEHDGVFREQSGVGRRVSLDAWHRVGFDNCDNSLITRLDGGPMSAIDVGASRELADARDPTLKQRLPRVTLLVTGIVLIRDVRVVRDRHWIARGRFGGDAPVTLGPDEVFVLGDRSSASFDGRDWGPVKTSALLGRPSAVVRPWAAARWLKPPKPWTEMH